MSDDFELDLGTSDLDEHERANRTPVPMEPNDRYSLVTNYLGQLQPNWQTADHEENRYGSSEDGDATPRVHTSPTVILRRAPFPVSEGSEMTSQAYSSPIEDGGSEGEGRDQDSSQINGTEESSADYRIGGYHPVAVGDIFKDRYHAIYKLGWGHFSIVWLCYDARMERYCAIKVVKSGQHYMETARDEVRLLQAIAESAWHPLRHRIVEFLDHFYISKQNGTHHCLVFEVLGDNLLTLIQMSNYQGLPIGNVKQIALQVLEGLNFLHSQCRIIHTDLKPENVLLVADDSTVRCQVNQAVTNFLKGHGQLHKQGHGDGTAKLTKTAKRRRRAQAKRSVAFFQEHRRWLRQRAIEDLLSLAERGQLSPVAAALGVTGKLRFMPFLFDDLVILTDNDMAELQRYFMTERVGDMPTALLNNRPPPQTGANQTGSVNASNANPGQKSDGSFSALRLLLKSPEQFMRYVQQKVTEADQKEMARNQYGKKQRAPKKHRKNEKKKKESRRKSSSAKNEPPRQFKKEVNIPSISPVEPGNQLYNLQLKIADIGNGCWGHHHYTDDIQTREYRAVEVILGAGYNETADIWSAACLFWELATGCYLFDPKMMEKMGRASQDEVHIAYIIEICGPIPQELIDQGDFSDKIFKPNGELRHITNLYARPLAAILINLYGWTLEEAKEFASFLTPMLQTDPSRRISARGALQHPWLRLEGDNNGIRNQNQNRHQNQNPNPNSNHNRMKTNRETTRPGTPDPRCTDFTSVDEDSDF